MEESFVIDNSSVEFLLARGKSKKKDSKDWYALIIRIGEVQQILCWLTANQYSTLTKKNI